MKTAILLLGLAACASMRPTLERGAVFAVVQQQVPVLQRCATENALVTYRITPDGRIEDIELEGNVDAECTKRALSSFSFERSREGVLAVTVPIKVASAPRQKELPDLSGIFDEPSAPPAEEAASAENVQPAMEF